jgi:hypothetical protein
VKGAKRREQDTKCDKRGERKNIIAVNDKLTRHKTSNHSNHETIYKAHL